MKRAFAYLALAALAATARGQSTFVPDQSVWTMPQDLAASLPITGTLTNTGTEAYSFPPSISFESGFPSGTFQVFKHNDTPGYLEHDYPLLGPGESWHGAIFDLVRRTDDAFDLEFGGMKLAYEAGSPGQLYELPLTLHVQATAVPEPSTAFLALPALWLVGRRQKR